MEPITREEYYLAKIAGTWQGKTPEPVTIEEYYLATMAGDYSGNTPQPVTRLQYYMAKAAGVWGGSIPAPVTRLEYYWAAIANGEGTVFQPVTREEHFLALVADAYSVVITVVTGNPALLEGVKGSRFTSLTLYGKSTQGSTTGAQLFDFENAMQKIIGNWTTTNILSAKDTNDISVNWKHLAGTAQTYIAIVSRFKFEANRTIYIAKKIGTHILIYDENGENRGNLAVQPYTPTESFNGYIGVGIDKGTKVDGSLIFSYAPNFSTAEPYTGGAPSPSPSYPQEIDSAGQSGEIGVTVTGTNLLPFEVGQKGDGFEAFADGVQVDVGRNVDIYAVGMNDSLIESGYSEIPLLAPGKYYIYSDIQGVNLYVVVWRKGANVTLGYSSGGVAKEIEVMAGDKFRIFLRTAAAFKGKVKAMITRIPVDATSYEPYKPAQKLIIPTPDGLPGIPVSSGGNYTDKDGQQWVADEIDLAMGERVQWVYHRHYASNELLYKDSVNFNIYTYKNEDVNIIDDTKHILVNVGRYNTAFAQNNNYRGVTGGLRGRVDDIKSENDIKNVFPNGIDVWFIRKTPIRTPLPPETIAAYKALHTYSPTTTVINDAGAGMSVGYKKAK